MISHLMRCSGPQSVSSESSVVWLWGRLVWLQLTGHVEALDLGHKRQDVSGGVLRTEHMVMPPLDGRKVGFTGGAVEELAEVLVKLVFWAICNWNHIQDFISFSCNNWHTQVYFFFAWLPEGMLALYSSSYSSSPSSSSSKLSSFSSSRKLRRVWNEVVWKLERSDVCTLWRHSQSLQSKQARNTDAAEWWSGGDGPRPGKIAVL